VEFSKLQPHSIGIVAANKKLDSHIIEVTPTETVPMVNGEITDHQADYKAKGTDDTGAAYQVEVKTTVSIKATWLPLGSMNRKTAPDVRRGEYVQILRFGDTDEYFWMTLWDDLKLRKLETVIYAFSGTKVEGAEVNAENYYFLEISTHKKLIHFHTSKADGEPFTYDIQINTKEGTILITDDIGNYISFDSKGRQIEMKNADGSLVEVNKTNINLICTDTITLQSANIVEKSSDHAIQTSTLSQQASNTTLSLGALQGSAGSGDLVIAGISHTGHTHIEQGDGALVSPPQ
jgi:hypothetical protein